MDNKRMIIKVCGMRNGENILQLERSGIADWMGMIFYPKSPRFVSEIPDYLPKKLRTFGVFVNPSIQDIRCRLLSYNLGGIQLHGQESPEFIQELRLKLSEVSTLDIFTSAFNALPDCSASQNRIQTSSLPNKKNSLPLIIKAFSVSEAQDIGKTKQYEGLCDYFLFDTKCSTVGGSGQQFDWNILQAYSGKAPFLLSGGIGPESLDMLKTFHHPKWLGIDLNSRFETMPGIKNITQLTKFCKEFKALYHE